MSHMAKKSAAIPVDRPCTTAYKPTKADVKIKA